MHKCHLIMFYRVTVKTSFQRNTIKHLCHAMGVWLLCLSGFAAYAGDLSVVVRDHKGKALENAVVSLTPEFDADMTYDMNAITEMRQQNTLFVPFVLPVNVGTKVSFPNLDDFRHHVYSFSETKRFELQLYGKNEDNSIVFDKPGTVALGCNIHDNMLAYIYVTQAPVFVKSGVDGVLEIRDLPDGPYILEIWHPGMNAKKTENKQSIMIKDQTEHQISVQLRRVWGVQSSPAEEQY